MKKRRMQDEREVGLNNQIGREAYGLVALLLIGAVCVKTYGMGLPVSSSLVELGVLLVSILYLIIRGVFLGNPLVDDSRRGRRWMALAALALSLVVAAGNGHRKPYRQTHEKAAGRHERGRFRLHDRHRRTDRDTAAGAGWRRDRALGG